MSPKHEDTNYVMKVYSTSFVVTEFVIFSIYKTTTYPLLRPNSKIFTITNCSNDTEQ